MGGFGGLGDKLGGGSSSLMGSLSALAVKFLPTQKAMKIEKVPPVLRPDAVRVKITYGPYKLRSAKVSNSEHSENQ